MTTCSHRNLSPSSVIVDIEVEVQMTMCSHRTLSPSSVIVDREVEV